MRPKDPLNSSSNFSKMPNISSCSCGAKCLGKHEGRSALYAEDECLSVDQNQPLQILDWTCETGVPIFLLTKNLFSALGY